MARHPPSPVDVALANQGKKLSASTILEECGNFPRGISDASTCTSKSSDNELSSKTDESEETQAEDEQQALQQVSKPRVRLFSDELSLSPMSPMSISSPVKSMKSQASFKHYWKPDQTLVFMDWDDTLFPTTGILETWGVKMREIQQGHWRRRVSPPLDPEQKQLMQSWEASTCRLITAVCEYSTCAIVTNAKPGWVESCLECFELTTLQKLLDSDKVWVLYACESSEFAKQRKRRQAKVLRPVAHSMDVTEEMRLRQEQLMTAKFEAMRDAAKKFYSTYEGQSWKNLISFGDASYERDALQELGMRRVAPSSRERLFIKTVHLPGSGGVAELGMRNEVLRLLVPTIVRHRDDLDIDLNGPPPSEAMGILAKDLELAKLKDVTMPLRCWGASSDSTSDQCFQDALVDLASALVDP